MTRKNTINKHLLLITLLYACLETNTATTGDGHRKFQYNKPADDAGAYNFAYDTGSKDAHSLRMEHRDDHGMVRGRYGYTDPHGKLRMVEYEAGPGGFKARGDVGPDMSLHAVAPAAAPIKEAQLTNLQLMGWDPASDPIEAEIVPKVYQPPMEAIYSKPSKSLEHDAMRIVQEPIVAIPITDDHPVKGHQAPVPIVQKSVPIMAAQITEDHPVKGYQAPVPIVQKNVDIEFDHHDPPKTIDIVAPIRVDHPKSKHPVPPAPLKAPPKHVVVAAPIVDHPEKGYQAPVPVVQKTSGIRVGQVKDVHHSPKTIDVVAPMRADHPVKGHFVSSAHLEAPPKSIVAVEPVARLGHLDKGEYRAKYISHPPDVVAVPTPVKRYEEKVHLSAPEHPKSVSVVAPVRMDHVDKVYTSPKHVVEQRVARVELDHHVAPPKSIAMVAPVKTSRHIDMRHEPPTKSVAYVKPAIDHQTKGYVAPQPLVGKSAGVRHGHHVDMVDTPQKSIAVAAPIVDHRTKGYEAPHRLVHKSATIEKPPHYHQHLENVYGPWVSGHVDYTPKSKSMAYTDTRKEHHHHSDGYKSSNLHVYPVSSGKQRHYHVEERRDPKVAHVVAGDRHHHHPARIESSNHDHPTFTKAKIPASRYHKHDGYSSAIVDRHSEVTTTDKHGKIIDHYHRRLEPLTIHNIDVDPNEIRTAARPASTHHHHSTYSASDRNRNSVRVVTDLPINTSDVIVREHVAPRSVSSPARTSSDSAHATHGARPRRVSYVAGNRYNPGGFVFA